jgi:hypothetical protein
VCEQIAESRRGDGEEGVVHAAAGTVRGLADRRQVGLDRGEPASWPGRRQQRARRGTLGVEPAARGDRQAQGTQGCGDPRPPASRGPGSTRARLRGCSALGARGRGPGVVEQPLEDGQPADPVGQAVMEHQHDPDDTGTGLHEHRAPQRPAPGKRFEDGAGGDVQELALVTRRPATGVVQVPGRVERSVLDPLRTSAARHDALTQPRDGARPLGDEAFGGAQVETRSGAEDQQCSEVLGYRGGVVHGEHDQVRRADGVVDGCFPADHVRCRAGPGPKRGIDVRWLRVRPRGQRGGSWGSPRSHPGPPTPSAAAGRPGAVP